jgi:lysophospholipase L1-like esterase
MHPRRSFLPLVCVLSISLCATGSRADEAGAQVNKPTSCVPAKKNEERHIQFMKDKEEQLRKGPIQLVFEGDSITDGWRGSGRAVFEEDYAKPYNCFNTGIGGDRTQHLLWRIDHGELDGLNPKVVVLMIGTNNSGSPVQEIAAGIKCVVSAIHEKLPNSKILLLAVFPRSPKATDPIRAKLKEANDDIAQLNGKENVTYLDIGPKFLEKDGTLEKNIMPDALHPNEKGYMIWAESMRPTLDEMMK